MAKENARKRRKREQATNQRHPDIPTEADWRSEAWDLEIPYAHKNFAGKSLEEAAAVIAENALLRQEDLLWMPVVCFRYYIRAHIVYLLSDDSAEDSDAASGFFNLVEARGVAIRESTADLVTLVENTLRHLAANQDWYDADVDIYGDFEQRAERGIKLLRS